MNAPAGTSAIPSGAIAESLALAGALAEALTHALAEALTHALAEALAHALPEADGEARFGHTLAAEGAAASTSP